MRAAGEFFFYTAGARPYSARSSSREIYSPQSRNHDGYREVAVVAVIGMAVTAPVVVELAALMQPGDGGPTATAAADKLVGSLRARGYALLRAPPAGKAVLTDYCASITRFYNGDDAAKAAALRDCGHAVEYKCGGDAGARAIASRREILTYTRSGEAEGGCGCECRADRERGALEGSCEAVMELCRGAALLALRAVADSLRVERALLEETLDPAELPLGGRGHDTLNAFKYHREKTADAESQVAVALDVHYDMNLLTVQLPNSEHMGLQLLDTRRAAAAASGGSGGPAWVDVERWVGAFDLLLFAGAPLHRLTAGFIPACCHRSAICITAATHVEPP